MSTVKLPGAGNVVPARRLPRAEGPPHRGQPHGHRGSRGYTDALALLLFVSLTAVIAYRVVTRLDVSGESRALGIALSDFRDAIYYPVVSFLGGHNPYDPDSFVRTYPVGNSFPLYLPSALVYHLPFGLLSFTTAELAYLLMTAALMPAFAYLTIRLCGLRASARSIFGLAALMLLSRPGYWNLFLGQYAATVAVAVCAALYFSRRRPWLAALGVAVASMKPTFGVPLAALMLARGDVRVVVMGVLLAAGISAGATGILIHNVGLQAFRTSLTASYAGFGADPEVNAATSTYRTDAVAFVSRFLGHPVPFAAELGIMMGVLGISALGVRRLARVDDDETCRLLSASLICVAMLTCTYHQTYDLLLLALPLTAVALASWQWAGNGRWTRWLLLASLAVPSFNYLASEGGLERVGRGWWLAVTSLNGGLLLLAWVLCTALALTIRRNAAPDSPSIRLAGAGSI